MDIRLEKLDPRDSVRLFVEGQLMAELTVGQVDTAGDLARAVEQTRVLQRLAWVVRQWQTDLQAMRDGYPDHIDRTPAARQAAFCRGLEAGLRGDVVAHPFPEVPPTPPEHTVSYGRGYQHGDCLRRCLAILEAPDAARDPPP